MKPLTPQQKRRLRRTGIAAGAAGLLVAGVLVSVPHGEDRPGTTSPEARARAAVTAGSPAAGADLAALITDREQRVRTHPHDGDAWALLGAAYVQRGRRHADPASYGKAERALDRALAAARTAPARGGANEPADDRTKPADGAKGAAGSQAATASVGTLLGLASLAQARHDYTAAAQWAQRAHERQAGNAAAYTALVDADDGLGDYAAAERAESRLENLRPAAPRSAVAAASARVYRDRGWREDATAQAVDASEHATTPERKAAALCTLGDLAWERGDAREALGQYDAALQAAPDTLGAQAGRGRALAALGRTDDAYQAYQTAIAHLPDPEYSLELGELYEAHGLTGDADSQYAKLRSEAEKAQAGGVDEDLVLGRYQADHGDPKAAVDLLTGEWDSGHRSMETADALSWALFRAGDATRALTYAKKAADQGRHSALFLYHRGEIERTLGMTDDARRHLADALRTNPDFSPLLAPQARTALAALGDPPAGGPEDVYGGADPGTASASPAAVR